MDAIHISSIGAELSLAPAEQRWRAVGVLAHRCIEDPCVVVQDPKWAKHHQGEAPQDHHHPEETFDPLGQLQILGFFDCVLVGLFHSLSLATMTSNAPGAPPVATVQNPILL